jgi:hypothetical protein
MTGENFPFRSPSALILAFDQPPPGAAGCGVRRCSAAFARTVDVQTTADVERSAGPKAVSR